VPNVSQQKDFLDALIAAIKGAIGTSSSASSKIADAQIVFSKHPLRRPAGTTLPCCIVAPVQETFGAGTNLAYDVNYGARVVLVMVGNQDLTTGADTLLYWRMLLMDLFADKRLSGFTASHLCKVEPGPVFGGAAFTANEDESSIIVRAAVRRTNK
jgi:hypothetical protein